MENENHGMDWWRRLSAREKEVVIGADLDLGLTSSEIAIKRGLDSRNSVITVRARIRIIRKAEGISMARWSRNGMLSYAGRRTRTVPNKPTPPQTTPSLYEDPEVFAHRRQFGKPFSLSARERRERGLPDGSEREFGGRLSPFPTPREVSGNPNDLSRAEIHAIASLYR